MLKIYSIINHSKLNKIFGCAYKIIVKYQSLFVIKNQIGYKLKMEVELKLEVQ